MKIVDCFIFYNELEMLLYRLNSLVNYVDYFIIVESRHTHSGKEKELFFDNNKKLFEAFNSKIIHIITDEFPYLYPNIDYSKNEQWINENFQRNSIKNGIDKIVLNEEDIFIVSDLDEIPDFNLLSCIKNNEIIINNISSLEQDVYYYNLNTTFTNKWYCCKIISYKKYKELNLSFQDIRQFNCNNNISRGGWHLSYFGDKHFIKNKLQHFGHQEFNNDNYTNLESIDTKITNQTDIYGGDNTNIVKLPIKQNSYLPHHYEKYLSKFVLY